MCVVKATTDTMTLWFWICSFLASWVYIHRAKITVEPYREHSQVIKARKNPFYNVTFQRPYCETLFIKHSRQVKEWPGDCTISQAKELPTS